MSPAPERAPSMGNGTIPGSSTDADINAFGGNMLAANGTGRAASQDSWMITGVINASASVCTSGLSATLNLGAIDARSDNYEHR